MKKNGILCNADGTPGARLVYIDPPFGTGDEYAITDDVRAYSAKMQGGRFIEFMRKRLILLRELMSDDGTIYIRIDYHFGHHIKLIADEIFGSNNFHNEIIINRFKRQLRGLTCYNVATDSLFFYSKSTRFLFHEVIRPRLCSFCGQEVEPKWLPMSSPGLRHPPERRICGRLLLPPRGRHWTFTQDRIDLMEKEGRIRIDNEDPWTDLEGTRHAGVPEYLQTEESPADSNWTDIKGYVRSARYPTENPEELLARVLNASSASGDLVLDAFAGSGTTCAVAEKLGRRWVNIDCGKLSIYTIQKRLLNLRRDIGNKGHNITPKPFTLYNAGLYDFAKLRELSWDSWRFFALQLFGCRDETHKVGGIQFDGYRQGQSVMVFDHMAIKHRGACITEETIQEIHHAVGSKVGGKVFIIAPALAFDFQQDYIDLDKVRYYALRIPYSIIHELHRQEFTALKQPSDESSVNNTVDAVGFDFIRTPELKYKTGMEKQAGDLFGTCFIKIETFKSDAVVREPYKRKANLETLSMVMLDYDYDEANKVFDLDAVYYADSLEKGDWKVRFQREKLGTIIMVVFLDIYGNEARVLIDTKVFRKPRLNRKNGRKK
ncbi:MAG: site-specific DNA-methyltransferase [candidate division Zixibacteria bacterium]|nr:site-specific DNA-methyltransferase [candidate division Zixibacteria bacterium]